MVSKKVEKFEELIVWQKSRDLVGKIYQLSNDNLKFSKDFDFKSQIRRAAISVMSNIAEGFGRNSDKAFSNFLNIAHGSVAEVQSQLYIALDLNYMGKDDFDKNYLLSEEISRSLKAFEKYLKKS